MSASSAASFVLAHKSWLLAAAAAAYVAHKLSALNNSAHTQATGPAVGTSSSADAATAAAKSTSSSSSSSASTSSGPSSSYDRSLFPQLIPSASVPGLSLYHRSWVVSQPTSVVFIIHGYGEHIGRYESVAAQLNEIGASVYGLDHQGHGQSSGDRAHIECFDHYVLDALSFVEHVQKSPAFAGLNKPLPCFLLAHSMGGLIATQMMRASYTEPPGSRPRDGVAPLPPPTPLQLQWQNRLWPWTGCVLSSPALMPNPKDTAPPLLLVANFLSTHLPKLQLLPLDAEGMSRNATVVAHYRADPLNWHGNMRARWGVEMLRVMNEVREATPTIRWPFLIIQGTSDTIVHTPGATALAEGAASRDKTLKLFEGGYHELFNDCTQAEAFAVVTSWITDRMPRS